MSGRHGDDIGPHGTDAADAYPDGPRAVMRSRPLQLSLCNRVERREQCFRIETEVDIDVFAIDELTLQRHQASRELHIADVNRQHDVAGCTHLGRTVPRPWDN